MQQPSKSATKIYCKNTKNCTTQSIAQNTSQKMNNSDTTEEDDPTGGNDLHDFLSISVGNNKETRNYKTTDHVQQYIITCFKYLLVVIIFTCNFLGLSVALNCNINEDLGKRIISGIFAFLFGFIYLLVNYYTFRVLIKGNICPMNPTKLFPFFPDSTTNVVNAAVL
jgi:hypothetical protein